ncbi:TetR/AcrR family transcriptional regulator [Kineococcus sp. G2]|uniref:TetR/AcrR family transcriptional regulator n=1 Tax=Kineococcus sp. G2 TaxID=3127484 RepID=UPI00301C84F3
MVRNPRRWRQLTDAGLSLLAREGSRGLTHRAVDAAAQVPPGTTSNYFRSRAALLEGLVQRIGERLTPDPGRLAELQARRPGRESFADHVRDIVGRLSTERDVTLALLELRLEAARRPEVAELLSAWLRGAFLADVAYNEAAGLPGGAREVALFHYAVDGLVLDRLTTSIDPSTTTDEVVDLLVARLLP